MSRCPRHVSLGLAALAAAVTILLAHGLTCAADSGLKRAELLLKLPDKCNTPDGMALLPSGDIILSVPNFNDKKAPPLLMKITKKNKLEDFYALPGHPETGRAGPMGIAVAPSGDLYLADNQIFHDPDGKPMLYGKSRLVRIVVKNGKPHEMVEVAYGFNVSNAVVVHEGFVYVTETILEPDSKPLASGVFRFKLGEEKVKLATPLKDDPHLIATIKTFNEKIPFGADGATFDDAGNLYLGNFADGTIHKLVLDRKGKVIANTIFAKASFMRSCDGIFYDRRTKKIYVADSMANAVQMVSPDGTVQTLAQDTDNDGSGGRLDQPCEVVVRGSEVIVSNMDFPVPGGVNTKFDKPYTMSFIKLGPSASAEEKAATRPARSRRPARRARAPLSFENRDFYGPDGKFNAEAAKSAYLKMAAQFGYPLTERMRKDLAVTDFGLGHFTDVGLAFVAWVNDKNAGYASLEVFLLPNQMIPEHWHVALPEQKVAAKMESWLVRYGSTFAYGEGEPSKEPSVKIHECQAKYVTVKHETPIRPGEVAGVGKPMEKHWQQAGPAGCILTEMSTFHSGEAVKFTDPKIKF